MNLTNLTNHAQRVLSFMLRAKQTTPLVPTMPDEKTRILRAKLIIEEAMETVAALGVQIHEPCSPDPLDAGAFKFSVFGPGDLVEVVDGCADISVVTIGTLLACGVEDVPVLECVDVSNLGKFGPGHSYREDGKLIKSPTFVKPNFEYVLVAQGYVPPAA